MLKEIYFICHAFAPSFKMKGGYKRGVVFIREIVPRPALSFVANTVFGERYLTMPMKNKWVINGPDMHISYAWKFREGNTLKKRILSTDYTHLHR